MKTEDGRRRTESSSQSSVVGGHSSEGADESGGIADVNAGLGQILGDDGPRADDAAIADFDGEDGGVGTDGDFGSDGGGSPEILAALGRAAGLEEVVDEHDAVSNEAIVTDGHQFTDEGVRLDFAAVADRGVSLDFDKRPDEAVVPNRAAVEIGWLDDLDVLAEANVDDTRLKEFGFTHGDDR